MAKADYFTVLESFVVHIDGANVEYFKGEVVDASDPVLRKSPHLFGPLVVRGASAPVEQATAAPGEVREVHAGRAISSAGLRGRK